MCAFCGRADPGVAGRVGGRVLVDHAHKGDRRGKLMRGGLVIQEWGQEQLVS
jgi:hypothetical protein